MMAGNRLYEEISLDFPISSHQSIERAKVKKYYFIPGYLPHFARFSVKDFLDKKLMTNEMKTKTSEDQRVFYIFNCEIDSDSRFAHEIFCQDDIGSWRARTCKQRQI